MPWSVLLLLCLASAFSYSQSKGILYCASNDDCLNYSGSVRALASLLLAFNPAMWWHACDALQGSCMSQRVGERICRCSSGVSRCQVPRLQFQAQFPPQGLAGVGPSANDFSTCPYPVRVMVFIDGTWLYYSIHGNAGSKTNMVTAQKGSGWEFGYSVNYNRLPQIISQCLQKELQQRYLTNRFIEIVRTVVYTSIKPGTPPDSRRMRMFREMEQANFEVHMLKALHPNQEKCVDIALTVSMMHYATLPGAYDIGVLISGDKDFLPALSSIRQMSKRVALCSVRSFCSKALLDPESHVRDFEPIWLDEHLDSLLVEKPKPLAEGATLLTAQELLKMIIEYLSQREDFAAPATALGLHLKGQIINGMDALSQLKQRNKGLYAFLDTFPDMFHMQFIEGGGSDEQDSKKQIAPILTNSNMNEADVIFGELIVAYLLGQKNFTATLTDVRSHLQSQIIDGMDALSHMQQRKHHLQSFLRQFPETFKITVLKIEKNRFPFKVTLLAPQRFALNKNALSKNDKFSGGYSANVDFIVKWRPLEPEEQREGELLMDAKIGTEDEEEAGLPVSHKADATVIDNDNADAEDSPTVKVRPRRNETAMSDSELSEVRDIIVEYLSGKDNFTESSRNIGSYLQRHLGLRPLKQPLGSIIRRFPDKFRIDSGNKGPKYEVTLVKPDRRASMKRKVAPVDVKRHQAEDPAEDEAESTPTQKTNSVILDEMKSEESDSEILDRSEERQAEGASVEYAEGAQMTTSVILDEMEFEEDDFELLDESEERPAEGAAVAQPESAQITHSEESDPESLEGSEERETEGRAVEHAEGAAAHMIHSVILDEMEFEEGDFEWAEGSEERQADGGATQMANSKVFEETEFAESDSKLPDVLEGADHDNIDSQVEPSLVDNANNDAKHHRQQSTLKLHQMTVQQLKNLLRERQLPVSGRKAELIVRLHAAMAGLPDFNTRAGK